MKLSVLFEVCIFSLDMSLRHLAADLVFCTWIDQDVGQFHWDDFGNIPGAGGKRAARRLGPQPKHFFDVDDLHLQTFFGMPKIVSHILASLHQKI